MQGTLAQLGGLIEEANKAVQHSKIVISTLSSKLSIILMAYYLTSRNMPEALLYGMLPVANNENSRRWRFALLHKHVICINGSEECISSFPPPATSIVVPGHGMIAPQNHKANAVRVHE